MTCSRRQSPTVYSSLRWSQDLLCSQTDLLSWPFQRGTPTHHAADVRNELAGDEAPIHPSLAPHSAPSSRQHLTAPNKDFADSVRQLEICLHHPLATKENTLQWRGKRGKTTQLPPSSDMQEEKMDQHKKMQELLMLRLKNDRLGFI